MTPLFQRVSKVAIGSVTRAFTDRPWRSWTVRFAGLIVLIGVAFWAKGIYQGSFDFHRPLPGYARMALSYIGGFLIGWTFRRFVRISFLIVASFLVWLGIAKFAGCDVTSLRSRLAHNAEVAREKAKEERDVLKGLLPSGAAAGVGVFWGYWRRNRGAPVTPIPIQPAGSTVPPPRMS